MEGQTDWRPQEKAQVFCFCFVFFNFFHIVYVNALIHSFADTPWCCFQFESSVNKAQEHLQKDVDWMDKGFQLFGNHIYGWECQVICQSQVQLIGNRSTVLRVSLKSIKFAVSVGAFVHLRIFSHLEGMKLVLGGFLHLFYSLVFASRFLTNYHSPL